MRPFLLLATREDDEAADNEYAAFSTLTGLGETGLERVRLERGPLPELDLDRFSGVLLGGGPFNASDPDPVKSPLQRRVEADLSRVLDAVLARDVPFLGACYGVGTLGGHQGGVVDRTYAEPVGSVQVTLTPAARRDPLFEVLPERFDAFVGHKEAVSRLPPHAVLLASSPTCPVQAFRVGRRAWATQFHPELDAEGLCLRIEVYRHVGYFAPDEATALKEMARASDVHDPPALLRRFVELHARD